MYPRSDFILHFLQHDDHSGKEKHRRWHLHPLPNRWKHLQPEASADTHENSSPTGARALVCRRLRAACTNIGFAPTHSWLLCKSSNSLRPHHQPEKTEVLYQPPPGESYCEPNILINNTRLNAVEHFTYLGSVMSNDATTDKDLDNHLSKASRSFGRLSKTVWQDHYLRISTKLKVYGAVIIPTLIYGAESWVQYRKQMRRLEQFHQRCLRKIFNIKWQEFVSNEEVLERSNLTSIKVILMKHQLRWAGHVTRMESERLPKAVFFGELSKGKRKRGAQKKRFKDQLKQHLALAGISPLTWQQEAIDRAAWRRYITEGCQTFESDRQTAATEKRKKQKERNRDDRQTAPTHGFPCPKCGRVCAARIGLYSHLWAFKK